MKQLLKNTINFCDMIINHTQEGSQFMKEATELKEQAIAEMQRQQDGLINLKADLDKMEYIARSAPEASDQIGMYDKEYE